MHAADFWSLSDDKLICQMCPRECFLPEGQQGFCGVRGNVGNKLYSLNYGQVSSLALDPIEKKPLARFKPGSKILSIGSWGCNLSCKFCQNWQIAKEKPPTHTLAPEQLVEFALGEVPKGNIGIAYTYNEPLVGYEFVRDCCLLANKAGLDNVLVSNGYIKERPLRELAPLLQAANIDLKAFTERFYNEICGGDLASVKNSIKIMYEYCHVEVTTLIVPGLNDDPQELEAIAKWLASIDRNIPYHITRYFPNYKLFLPATQTRDILALQKVAAKHLRYVYAGNI